MILDIFSQKSIMEQEYILKYFFLIDPDSLAIDIRKQLNAQGREFSLEDINDIDLFFHIAFEELYKHLSLYSDFIPTNGNMNTFFGESVFDSEQQSILSFLLKLALYNFCISEGFFHFLEDNYFINAEKSFYPLTATYEPFFQTGFFSNPTYNENFHQTSDAYESTRIHINWNHHASIFNKLDDDSFLRFVVRDCLRDNSATIKQYYNNAIASAKIKHTRKLKKSLGFSPLIKNTLKLYVPNIYKFSAYTYFTERSLSSLSKNMKRTKDSEKTGKTVSSNNTYKNIISLYNNLYKVLKVSELDTLSSSKADVYIFRTLNERYFGFSTISYLEKNYTNSDFSAYKGSIFSETLRDLSLCPLVYSRHFFLNYAINALKNNKVLETQFLTVPATIKIAESAPEKHLTESETLLLKQDLIKNYFRTLNRMVLPLFSALWKTTISHLMESLEVQVPVEIFQKYIENHFELQSADFTEFTEDELLNCLSLYCKSSDKNAYWTVLVKEIEKICVTNARNAQEETEQKVRSQATGPAVDYLNHKKTLEFSILLRDFLLRPQNYIKESKSALPVYSYFSPTDLQARHDPFNRRILEFQTARAKNIYDYCTKLLIL